MSEKFDEVKYKNQYTRENYDRLSLALPKGMKGLLNEYCKKHNVSATSLIVQHLMELFYNDGMISDEEND